MQTLKAGVCVNVHDTLEHTLCSVRTHEGVDSQSQAVANCGKHSRLTVLLLLQADAQDE